MNEKHLDHVEKWDSTLKELAEAIASMRYDKVHEFLQYFSKCFAEQHAGKSGKPQLTLHLKIVHAMIEGAGQSIWNAWNVCKKCE